ncbi:hypothetical protein [Polymorphospora rubra]|uniref:Uncharacterized protein n=1 Tax=Polymorphospora rubra TaxID=338584 RepID=A0A810MY53_9ACTN|nr:hypothetical protein [Polymorphospora rubra]BCJ64899.1 hypothetical protein Prubr_19200 [Polymorphospora rubra]
MRIRSGGGSKLVKLATVLVVALAGCAEPEKQTTVPVDPEAVLMENLAGLDRDDPYRDPDPDERESARQAIRLLLDDPGNPSRPDEILARLGFTAYHDVDPATGRPFSLFVMNSTDEPAWGALLVDRSAGVRTVIEVPHPTADINTEKLGIAVFRQLPGSVLLVAGAHRTAADGAADVAHNERSMFHQFSVEFARKGLLQIQLHGFADRSLPDAQAVVSSGPATVSRAAREVGDGLADAGLTTCLAWLTRCGRLEGTRNEQGRVAAEQDAPFIHLELGWSVRGDPASLDRVAKALGDRLASR